MIVAGCLEYPSGILPEHLVVCGSELEVRT
jgi:hypothetical protein